MIGNRVISTVVPCSSTATSPTSTRATSSSSASNYEQLELTADGFEIEAELTGGLLRNGAMVYEVPISYSARRREQGKKIRARDGLTGLVRLLRVRLMGY